MPSYLQELLEKKLHHKGLDLRGLIQLALAMEVRRRKRLWFSCVQELVGHEARNRLATAYEIHGFAKDQTLSRQDAEDVTRTWYVSFLLAGNFSASSPEEVHGKKAIFARKYSDWLDADRWLSDLEKEHYSGRSEAFPRPSRGFRSVSRALKPYRMRSRGLGLRRWIRLELRWHL